MENSNGSKLFKLLLCGIVIYILYNLFVKKKVGNTSVTNVIDDIKKQIHFLENKFDKTDSEESYLDDLYSKLLNLTKSK